MLLLLLLLLLSDEQNTVIHSTDKIAWRVENENRCHTSDNK